MISEKSLETAVERGLLNPGQADALRAIESELAASRLDPPDDEKLRFITGFGDIFVTLGLWLFLTAGSYLGNMLFGPGAGPLVVVVASWLLAEFFTRRRRMALPSIVLLLTFAFSTFSMVMGLLGSQTAFASVATHPGAVVAAGVVTALATLAHYWRFRIPITIAAGAAALVAIVIGLLGFAGAPNGLITPALFLCGLAIFALAMRFDMSDPARQTRRTDIAFWLHLLAAPLIVHPLVAGVWSGDRLATGGAIGVLCLFLGLGIVAVLVNRRALLVSGLIYAGSAFASLIRDAGLSDGSLPLTLLALGAFVLLLSAGWDAIRRRLLSVVPGGLKRNLPSGSSAPT